MAKELLALTFPAIAAFGAVSDLLTMTISNRLCLLAIGGFFVAALATGLSPSEISVHLATGTSILTITFALFARGWIGGGDAKFTSAIALWLGLEPLPNFLLLAAVMGGLLTITLLLVRRHPLPSFALRWTWVIRLHDQRSGVPYGIALSAAALSTYPQSALFKMLTAN